ncbi:hypothetical protein ACIBL3_45175 [Kribbella sp. NPDC050124]|uniref:hypothetical protein n=1 Tax=Kribbella sp. NPDC050124 TaxID=3364114 RepID=UPI0037B694A0
MLAATLLLPLFVLLLITLLVVSIVVIHKKGSAALRRRAAEAAQSGWVLAPPNPWLMDVAARLFTYGEPGEMFAGQFRGRGMCVLDYVFSTAGANGQVQRRIVHVVALNLPVPLPPLTLTKERVLGGGDQEFENQAFNDRFQVDCADDRFASAVLTPRMMEWMLFNGGLEWQVAGNALVSWGDNRFVVRDVLARLEAMEGVIERIPPQVFRDYAPPAR